MDKGGEGNPYYNKKELKRGKERIRRADGSERKRAGEGN